MRDQDHIQPGEVELVIQHLPGCRCDLPTPDPEATLVQLGCVTGYLVNRSARSQLALRDTQEDA
jgi:hypothetical protein